jgi:hypothetical protein
MTSIDVLCGRSGRAGAGLLEYEMIIAGAVARHVRAPWIPAVRRMIMRRRLELRLRDTVVGTVYRAGRRLIQPPSDFSTQAVTTG